MQIALLSRARQIFSLLRLKPFETLTDEGHARERHRRILLATLASAMAKGVAVLTSLVIMPMTLRYLGEERYAVWVKISSLFLTLNVVDFGIGYGLLNAIASANGKDDRLLIKKNVSNGFLLLSVIGGFLGLLVLLACAVAPVGRMFGAVSASQTTEVRYSVAVMAVLLGFALPLTVALRFQEGLQEGFNNYLAQMAGNLLALGFALIIVALKFGLPWLVFALLAGPCVGNLGTFVLQFLHFKKWSRPAWADFDLKISQALIKTGIIFFGINILSVIGSQIADPFFIAHAVGPAKSAQQITAYSFVLRLSQLTLLYWALTQALWPAYAEAISRQDFGWVRRTIVRSLRLSICWGIGLGLMIDLLGKRFLILWLGKGTALSLDPALVQSLLLSFAVYTLIFSIVLTLGVIINGSQLLKEQLVFLFFTTVMAVALKMILGKMMGAPGVVWATSISFSVGFILPAGWLIRKTYWST